MSVAVSATKLEIPTADELIAAADVAFENMEREEADRPSLREGLSGLRLGVHHRAHA